MSKEKKGVVILHKQPECLLPDQDKAEDITYLLEQFLEKEARDNPIPTMEPKRRMPPSTSRY